MELQEWTKLVLVGQDLERKSIWKPMSHILPTPNHSYDSAFPSSVGKESKIVDFNQVESVRSFPGSQPFPHFQRNRMNHFPGRWYDRHLEPFFSALFFASGENWWKIYLARFSVCNPWVEEKNSNLLGTAYCWSIWYGGGSFFFCALWSWWQTWVPRPVMG